METTPGLPGIPGILHVFDAICNLRWTIVLIVYLCSVIAGIGLHLQHRRPMGTTPEGNNMAPSPHAKATDEAPIESQQPMAMKQTAQKVHKSWPHDQRPTEMNPGQIFNGEIRSQNLTINNGICPKQYAADQAVLLSQIQSLRKELHTLAGYLRKELGNFTRNQDAPTPSNGGQSWWDFPQVYAGPGPWAPSNFDPYSYGSDLVDEWGTDMEYEAGWGPYNRENDNHVGINEMEDAGDDQKFEERPEEDQTWYEERAVVDVEGINTWRDNTTEGQALAASRESSVRSGGSSSQPSNQSRKTQSPCAESPVTPEKRPQGLFFPLSNYPSTSTTSSPMSTYFERDGSGIDCDAPPCPRNSIFSVLDLQGADTIKCNLNRSLQKEFEREQMKFDHDCTLDSTNADVHRDPSITVDIRLDSPRETNQHSNPVQQCQYDTNDHNNGFVSSSQHSQEKSELDPLQPIAQTISGLHSPGQGRSQSQSRSPSISSRSPDPHQAPQDMDIGSDIL